MCLCMHYGIVSNLYLISKNKIGTFSFWLSCVQLESLLHDDVGHHLHLLLLPRHGVVERDVKEAGGISGWECCRLLRAWLSVKGNFDEGTVGQLPISLPGEQSLGGRPLLSPHVAPVAVAACEPCHLTRMARMNVISRATVLTKMTKWIMVSVITNMTMMTMSITPIKQTWNSSKNLYNPVFGRTNFTHWKRVNRDYFRQQ